MTNAEALLARVGYPLSENQIHIALENRAMVPDDLFVALENVQAMDLAYADCLVMLVSAPASVSEGGFSVSVGDRNLLTNMANKVFAKYGETSPLPTLPSTNPAPKATFVQRW